MVPFVGERRHRLSDEEVPVAIRGLELLLRKLLKEREELPIAIVAFKTWFKLTNHHLGGRVILNPSPGPRSPSTWKWYRFLRGIELRCKQAGTTAVQNTYERAQLQVLDLDKISDENMIRIFVTELRALRSGRPCSARVRPVRQVGLDGFLKKSMFSSPFDTKKLLSIMYFWIARAQIYN